MVAAPFTRPTPPATFTPIDEAEHLAQALAAAVLPPGGPTRCSLMNGPDRERKYSDPPKGHRFTVADMRGHLRAHGQPGARTWAVALRDSAGLAVAGCRDYDGADGQGAALGLQALAAAAAAGLSAFAILVAGRAHVWAFYRRPAPAADIAHQLASVLPLGPGEIYPSGNPIRLPLGYHRRALTRGTLILPDGQRFSLDAAAQLRAGLRAILGLARNPAPPEAPPAVKERATSQAAPRDEAAWADLPDGAALMGSSRYIGPRGIFTRRPQLRALAQGRRVTLETRAGPNDSGSEQVAALVANLLTTGRPAAPGEPLVAGLGAPTLAEIRALALHWRAALRPDQDLGAYQVDVDRLIQAYTPAGYAPEATHTFGQAQAAPARLDPPKGRPAGQRAEQAERLAELLAQRVGQVVKRAELAELLGVCGRTIGLYIDDLGARVELARARYGQRVVRVEINSKAGAEEAPAEVAEGSAQSGNRSAAPEAAQRTGAAQSDHAAAIAKEHTAPPGLLSGAGAAPLDLAALAAELVEHYGACWARAKVAARKQYGIGGRGDGARVAELRAAYVAAATQARAEGKRQTAEKREAAQAAFWAEEFVRVATLEPSALYDELRAHLALLDRAQADPPAPWAALTPEARARQVDKARRRDDTPAAREQLAQEKHAAAIATHRKARRAAPRAQALANTLRAELGRRGLPLTPPPATIGARGKAPGRTAAAQAREVEQAELWAAVDRMLGRAAPTPRPNAPRASWVVAFADAAGAPAGPVYDTAGLVERLRRVPSSTPRIN